jgi:D-alanyl-lipoteichoic acid acyltransferase DltB (MBOAT superfamily)
MLFNSLEFLIFFPVVVTIYFFLPIRWRLYLLLAASYYFYAAWKAEYIILILASTVVDYFVSLQIGKTRQRFLRSAQSRRRMLLAISLFANLGILFLFKYFDFLANSFNATANILNLPYDIPLLNLVLPIGISFYTFQTLSYTIDVYRGRVEPEANFLNFALYVSFFPQLVAGPIERPSHLLPQFYKQYEFDYDRVVDGLTLMLVGMFKKVVVADRLSFYVNEVYNNPADSYGITVLIATYFFAFQIYCDFSGYSDMAIGAARVMGYDLRTNFAQPYFSKSVAEFWRRWHISLSTWFRDYLYIPLGGNRVKKSRWYANLLIVFLVSGLWHGANWTFVVWGALHGCYLLLAIWTQQARSKVAQRLHLEPGNKSYDLLSTLITFNLVVFAWVFFRAASISDAFLLISHIFEGDFWQLEILRGWRRGLVLSLVWILVVVGLDFFIQKHKTVRHVFSNQPLLVRWAVYLFLVLSIMNLGYAQESPFIYFQF